MRFLICIVSSIVLFGCINAIQEKEPSVFIFEDVINQTIEGLKESLPEIIQLNNLSIVLPSPLEGSLSVESIEVTGIKELVATAIKFSLIPMSLELTILVPDFKLAVKEYDANVSALGISFWGQGDIDVEITNIQVAIDVGIDLSNGTTLKDLIISLNVDTADFSITGIFNNEELSKMISDCLTESVAPLINDYAAVISEIISPIIQEIINAILHMSQITKYTEELQKNIQQIEKTVN